jgi:hypothetical protein
VTGTVASTAWYVYAFVAPVPPLEGELQAVGDETLAAIVGRVPLEDFAVAVLPERLNDRAWLEEKARSHERVVERLGEASTVIPLRFGSVYHDLVAVEELVASRRDELLRIFDRVRGRVEIGVQAWLDGKAAEPETRAASGRDYLQQRRNERARAEETALRLQEVLADAHERLSMGAVEGVLNRPQARELTGRAQEMVFNGAYLVPADDQSLAARVGELNDRYRRLGLTFELTGPWPPYNFVDVDDRR